MKAYYTMVGPKTFFFLISSLLPLVRVLIVNSLESSSEYVNKSGIQYVLRDREKLVRGYKSLLCNLEQYRYDDEKDDMQTIMMNEILRMRDHSNYCYASSSHSFPTLVQSTSTLILTLISRSYLSESLWSPFWIRTSLRSEHPSCCLFPLQSCNLFFFNHLFFFSPQAIFNSSCSTRVCELLQTRHLSFS